MAAEIVMPQMGAEMEEGTVVRWVKQPGDEVHRGDIIAEIETDKATVDLESFDEGVFPGSVVETGVALPVGTVIGYLGAKGEALPGAESPGAAAPAAGEQPPAAEAVLPSQRSGDAAPAEGQPAAAMTGAVPPPPPANGAHAPVMPSVSPPSEPRRRVSPVARGIAEELGIDLSRVPGNGPDGRIMRRDVEEFSRTQATATPAPAVAPSPPPEQQVTAEPAPATADTASLSRMRRAIARRMSAAKRDIPHYYLTMSADMTEAMALRRQINAALPTDQRVSVNDLIVKAAALALERYPVFNSTLAGDDLRQYDSINIGVAVALDDGLIVPAVLDCRGKSLGALSRQAADVTERARSGRLKPAELSDGTFTVSNLGMQGVETLIAIIQPGQAAILGVGQVEPRPVVRDGQIVAREMMTLALSADHRITDGAQGAHFLAAIVEVLEQPIRLAL